MCLCACSCVRAPTCACVHARSRANSCVCAVPSCVRNVVQTHACAEPTCSSASACQRVYENLRLYPFLSLSSKHILISRCNGASALYTFEWFVTAVRNTAQHGVPLPQQEPSVASAIDNQESMAVLLEIRDGLSLRHVNGCLL